MIQGKFDVRDSFGRAVNVEVRPQPDSTERLVPVSSGRVFVFALDHDAAGRHIAVGTHRQAPREYLPADALRDLAELGPLLQAWATGIELYANHIAASSSFDVPRLVPGAALAAMLPLIPREHYGLDDNGVREIARLALAGVSADKLTHAAISLREAAA